MVRISKKAYFKSKTTDSCNKKKKNNWKTAKKDQPGFPKSPERTKQKWTPIGSGMKGRPPKKNNQVAKNCRDGVRKPKAEKDLRLARDAKSNNKKRAFFKYLLSGGGKW